MTVQAKGVNVAGGQTAVTDAARHLPISITAAWHLRGRRPRCRASSRRAPSRSSLSLGQVLKIDLTMQLSTVTETVQVTSESPLIDVKQSTASQTVRADMIDRLPKGRDFTSLVTLAPGANNESRSGGISIDGASSAENRYFIDGTDTTNLRTGLSGKTLLPEFIEEVQVKSSGYQAEFGGATGGVVNVVTKSGSNSFRGDIGTYFQNDGMCCDERPTLRLVLSGQNASEYVTLAEDEYSRWEPFMQVGGPIFRNRLWFYGGYTPQLDDTNRTVTFRSNSQTRTYNSDEKRHYSPATSWRSSPTSSVRGWPRATTSTTARAGCRPRTARATSPPISRASATIAEFQHQRDGRLRRQQPVVPQREGQLAQL